MMASADHAVNANQTAKELEFTSRVFLFGALAAMILEAAVHFRPGPFDTIYAPHLFSSFLRNVLAEWLGISTISLPFFFNALLAGRRGARRSAWTGRLLHVALCFASLVASHADNETSRFMGIHLTWNYLETYGRIGKTPAAIGFAIADDPGGPYSAYLLLIVPALFLLCVGRCPLKRLAGARRPTKRLLAVIGFIVFVFLPALTWFFGNLNRSEREQFAPPIFRLASEIKKAIASDARVDLGDIGEQIREFQSWWQMTDSTGNYRFISTEYPLLKTLKTSCGAERGKLPNILLLQLETFRAKDMKSFNSALDCTPTPFIDSLTRSEKTATWTRFFCNGLPTVYAFMSLHTGLLPHRYERVATAFTDVRLRGLPEIFHSHGYHTAFFSGPDPEWDNEQFWVDKWYDYSVYNPEYEDRDRPLFREVASYLKSLPETKRPFFVTVVSITNHVPFRSPEPALNLNGGDSPRDRLHNTMRYTDDVVREFYESIKSEPWFDDTLLLVTGDHGYDLGDRGYFIGHTNLRHETTWVPFLLHGRAVAQINGRHGTVGSHIDVAPTLLELCGICEDNSFIGHSLIRARGEGRVAITVREGNAALETDFYSAYFPSDKSPLLFRADDILQLTDTAPTHSDIVHRYANFLEMILNVSDYVYEQNRVTPPKP